MILEEKIETFSLKTLYYVSHGVNQQGLNNEGVAQEGSSWPPLY
jgi:hypothetical protein